MLSKGDNGSVWQTNSVDSDADASNRNSADQSIDQEQSGTSGSGIQTADQDAENKQAAIAASSAEQKNPSNTNVSIRVLSKGDNGKVVQTNSVESDADAKNSNWTDQSVEQDQSAGRSTDKCGCKGDKAIQTADQSAKNEQFALGLSFAKQEDASNKNAPIRVGSKGDDGSVWQTNSVDSDADATNKNGTEQDITQTQSGGSGSPHERQHARRRRTSAATARPGSRRPISRPRTSRQQRHFRRRSRRTPRTRTRRCVSDSKGDGGKVVQTNSVESDADAKNSNWTDQSVEQDQSAGGSTDKCGCKGSTGIQTADQSAKSEQFALGLSFADAEGRVEQERAHPRQEQG